MCVLYRGDHHGSDRIVVIGAIQVLRNAVGWGGWVSAFLEKSITKVYGTRVRLNVTLTRIIAQRLSVLVTGTK